MRVISGIAKGRKLLAPNGQKTRPTADRVKEGLFSAIQFEIPGRRVLDLFGGSGQLAIEALSRGATEAVIVDYDGDAVRLIRENLRMTGLSENARIVRDDYLHFLRCTADRFDLIFLDPPYAENYLENAMKCISEIDILRDDGIIICEKPAEKHLPESFPGLKQDRAYRYGTTSILLYRKECGQHG